MPVGIVSSYLAILSLLSYTIREDLANWLDFIVILGGLPTRGVEREALVWAF
jgi:hypothetical protein